MRIRNWFTFAILLTVTATVRASWVYHDKLVNDSALRANRAYSLDLSSAGSKEGVDRVSAQAVYSISGSTTAYTGNVGLQWLVSNNGVNYVNAVGISSVTYLQSASTTTATSSLWDFGLVDFRYLQLYVVAPSSGALNLVVTVYGKN